ncbi:hypothetical protein ACFVZW_16910 [Streptomyces sp. NPDC059567]|uniref:hypothetical protein n=1 Tax=Streptomyces sp. NPDC059567 TaxID=3346867 RepID=UPI0036998A76
MNEQRTPGRRGVVLWILIACGLVATAVELTIFGGADVTDGLTYAGRISGVVFLAAAILEVVAFGALFSPAKYSGALVILGVLISLLTNVVLLILHLDGSFTYYSLFLILLPWACWALLWLYKKGVWSRVPHARGFAAGVALTGLLAVANFTHTQVYQPYTATAMLTTSVEFGAATAAANGAVSVPLRLRTRNSGKVGVYVLGSLYQLSARPTSFVRYPRPDKDWLQDINSGQRDLMRYTNVHAGGYELLAQGQFAGRAGPAMVLEPGAEIVTRKVIQFPRRNTYEVLAATANVAFLRKDRAKLTDDYARSGSSSWNKEYVNKKLEPRWVTNDDHGDNDDPVNTFRYESRIAHSTAVLENTRAPHYVTVWWALHEVKSEGPFGPDLVAVVGPKEALGNRPSAADTHRMAERYGLAYAPSGTTQISMAELLKAP